MTSGTAPKYCTQILYLLGQNGGKRQRLEYKYVWEGPTQGLKKIIRDLDMMKRDGYSL